MLSEKISNSSGLMYERTHPPSAEFSRYLLSRLARTLESGRVLVTMTKHHQPQLWKAEPLLGAERINSCDR